MLEADFLQIFCQAAELLLPNSPLSGAAAAAKVGPLRKSLDLASAIDGLELSYEAGEASRAQRRAAAARAEEALRRLLDMGGNSRRLKGGLPGGQVEG